MAKQLLRLKSKMEPSLNQNVFNFIVSKYDLRVLLAMICLSCVMIKEQDEKNMAGSHRFKLKLLLKTKSFIKTLIIKLN